MASSATPTAMASELARPAPATPSGWPVPQPAISTGARMAFRNTVSTCTIMVGLTIPVPRSAEPMATTANCRPRLGRNQCRYSMPAATAAAASAPKRAPCKAPRRDHQRGCVEHGAERGQRQALVEHQIRIRLVLATGRMRDERDRAHAQHLGDRKHDEHHVAGGADAGDRRIAQMGDEIQIDQKIKCLKQHARRNGQPPFAGCAFRSSAPSGPSSGPLYSIARACCRASLA